MDDVIPFLENVTRGRNVPRERLEEVAHHYELFGGVSPINAQNRALDRRAPTRARRTRDRAADLLRQPQLASVPRRHAAGDGRRRRRARARLLHLRLLVVLGVPPVPRGPRSTRSRRWARRAPEVLKTRVFFNHPGWIEANADHVRDALAQLPARRDAAPRVHGALDPASRWRGRAATRISCASRRGSSRRRSASPTAELVYQSRSGPPHVPWLEPDILDHLRDGRRARRRRTSCVSPIGFVSDHLEVLYDLDIEARDTGRRARPEPRARVERVDAPGVRRDDPRADRGAPRTPCADAPAVGRYAASHDVCPIDCCLPGTGRPSPWAVRSGRPGLGRLFLDPDAEGEPPVLVALAVDREPPFVAAARLERQRAGVDRERQLERCARLDPRGAADLELDVVEEDDRPLLPVVVTGER